MCFVFVFFKYRFTIISILQGNLCKLYFEYHYDYRKRNNVLSSVVLW